MWQSGVEIKHYSVAQLNHITIYLKHCNAKLLLKAGLIRAAKMHEYLMRLCSMYDPPPLAEVLRYSASNSMMHLKYAAE